MELRRLTDDDRPAAFELGRLAFGGPREMPPGPLPSGLHRWGMFDGTRLVARAIDLEHTYFLGGREVPGSGVAGVAVAPEYRGRGVGRALLAAVVEAARDRGAVISLLYPTVAAVYARLGWVTVGSLRTWSVATTALAGRPGNVRAATEDDLPRIIELYRSYAASGTCMLGRTGSLFPPSLDGPDGSSLALADDGTITGYLSWNRGRGYGDDAVLEVDDLIAADGAALDALLALLGSWASVTPTVHLRLRVDDPVLHRPELNLAKPLTEQRFMLRVLDPEAAVAARGWAADGAVDLSLPDGPHVLRVENGEGTLTCGGSGAVTTDLSALYAGLSPAVMRRAGLADSDFPWLAAGPPPAMLDYF